MGEMKVNLDGLVGNCRAKKGYQYSLEELVRNLKELRDRSNAGDETAIKEFFNLYVFGSRNE